jgi:hypothetical protein
MVHKMGNGRENANLETVSTEAGCEAASEGLARSLAKTAAFFSR